MNLIRYKQIDKTKGRIDFIHYFPETLPAEDRSNGIMLDSIPVPEHIPGNEPIYYINPVTKEIWFEYIAAFKSKEEIIEELRTENESLKLEKSTLLEQVKTLSDLKLDLETK